MKTPQEMTYKEWDEAVAKKEEEFYRLRDAKIQGRTARVFARIYWEGDASQKRTQLLFEGERFLPHANDMPSDDLRYIALVKEQFEAWKNGTGPFPTGE